MKSLNKTINKVIKSNKSSSIALSLKTYQMKTLITLSENQIERVKNDLLNTQILLNKELSYSKDLQHNNYISMLESLTIKLNEIITKGCVTTGLNN